MTQQFDDKERFAMVYQAEGLEGLFQSLATKQLQPMDICVLLAMISRMDRVGKVRCSAKAIAELIGCHYISCVKAIGRLRVVNALVKVYDRQAGAHYFILNPYIASVGSAQNRGHLWAQFKLALEEND